jgi:rfaE bifunctional protein nucleotidyltransferase chain/domain
MRNSKIKSLDELERLVQVFKSESKKIIHCHGVFDLLHPGHVLHLKAARQFGDVLIVTVTPDRYVHKGPGRPVFNEQLRLEILAALECVEFAALNEWPTAVETITRLKPDVYVKGNDYADGASDLTGNISYEERVVKEFGGEIRFTDEEVFSSSALINKFFNPYPSETQNYLARFRDAHSVSEVIDCLQGLADIRVLVVGEAILDRYSYCLPLAKSPKEFMIATKFVSQEDFAGGSLAVANHVAGYCDRVTLVTSLGFDGAASELLRSTLRSNIKLLTIGMQEKPTITKQRFVEPTFLTKLFELQYLDDTPLQGEPETKLISMLEEELARHDMVIVSDFGHGLLTERVREVLYSQDKFLAVNTQTNSANFGFNPITKYKRASYVCIHEGELRLSLQTQFDDFYGVAARVREQLNVQKLMVTRGPNGSELFCEDGSVYTTPALAIRVVDRVGAGDAFFAVTAPCAYKNYHPNVIGLIGNCVGAMAVETVGNREPVDPKLLFKYVSHLLR